MKKKKEKPDRGQIIAEWLNYYPIREMEYEKDDKEQVVILVPPVENWLVSKILPKPKKPAQRIHLDEIGTFVWEHCDGKLSIREIGEHLAGEFSQLTGQVDERIVQFLQQMYQQNFINVYTKNETA
jgi:hypothetical protein